MDKLAPKLIRRAKDRHYKAVIIDPIYKVITGDENSADQMAKFCNQFDKVCTELGASVIYCHHHSKGSQGQKKSMDRASGSGVFARDPDALLDMIELPLTEAIIKQEVNKVTCRVCLQYLRNYRPDLDFETELSADDMLSAVKVKNYCDNKLDQWQLKALIRQVDEAVTKVQNLSAWRIEGTLREFPKFPPVNTWFDYPIHKSDETGILRDIDPEMELTGYQKMVEVRKKQAEKKNEDMLNQIEVAFEGLQENGIASAVDLAEQLGISSTTLKKWFGNGKQKRPEYKKRFDVFTDPEDKKLYLRAKNE